MEQTEERCTLLQQIPTCAFLVENGVIAAMNTHAQGYQLQIGQPIQPLLATGQQEYAQFTGGCLYLSLQLLGLVTDFSVRPLGRSHLFIQEEDADRAELRAMALAAQALRNPLSNVMSAAQRLSPVSTPVQEDGARLNRSLYQLYRVVCNMSDAYAFSEAGQHMELRNIVAIIRENLDLAAPLVSRSGLTLRQNLPQESIYTVVDAAKLERAVNNMLSNAMKFSPSGSCIDVSLTRRGKMLYLTVQDQGPGISSDILPQVYDRYRRSPGLEDGRFGLGIGMVLIRGAAAAHGGTVLLEQSRGLKLTMTLPLRQAGKALLRTPTMQVDYAGAYDHLLLELSDVLPAELYHKDGPFMHR